MHRAHLRHARLRTETDERKVSVAHHLGFAAIRAVILVILRWSTLAAQVRLP